jgi:hypothetical protein
VGEAHSIDFPEAVELHLEIDTAKPTDENPAV